MEIHSERVTARTSGIREPMRCLFVMCLSACSTNAPPSHVAVESDTSSGSDRTTPGGTDERTSDDGTPPGGDGTLEDDQPCGTNSPVNSSDGCDGRGHPNDPLVGASSAYGNSTPPPTSPLVLEFTLEREPSAGQIDGDIIEQGIRRRQRAIERCLESDLPDSFSPLTLRAEFVIDPNGATQEVTALDALPQTTECLTSTLRRLRFRPGPTGGAVRYRITYEVSARTTP